MRHSTSDYFLDSMIENFVKLWELDLKLIEKRQIRKEIASSLKKSKGWTHIAHNCTIYLVSILRFLGINISKGIWIVERVFPFARYIQGIQVLIRFHLAQHIESKE